MSAIIRSSTEADGPCGGRYWWQQELAWDVVLTELGLDAFEVLLELEESAVELRERALLEVLDALVLDPGLGELWDELVELEPWEWLRATSLYRGLEQLAFEPAAEPTLAGVEAAAGPGEEL